MRKLLLVSLIAFMFVGCSKEAQSTEIIGNGVNVEFLFEKDGIKVYRFYDGGRPHYFTSKGDETISTQSNGKNTWDENIE